MSRVRIQETFLIYLGNVLLIFGHSESPGEYYMLILGPFCRDSI